MESTHSSYVSASSLLRSSIISVHLMWKQSVMEEPWGTTLCCPRTSAPLSWWECFSLLSVHKAAHMHNWNYVHSHRWRRNGLFSVLYHSHRKKNKNSSSDSLSQMLLPALNVVMKLVHKGTSSHTDSWYESYFHQCSDHFRNSSFWGSFMLHIIQRAVCVI